MENSEKDANPLLDRNAASDGPLPPSEPVLAPGQKVGAYVLVGKLGAGGIGEVWKARDPRLNRVVALKFISAVRQGSSPMRDLLREARAASALNHPNIVTIFEVGESGSSAFLAMEFVEGETLRARLKRPPLPLEEALDLAGQIAAGLAAAHRVGIVHRDLKPENVMLRADGLVKLMDFGLAKVVSSAQQSTAGFGPTSQATESGAIVGTLTYMSPEQARGQALTPASDIFSFGILFHELLTAEHPFQAETPMDTLFAIVNKEPPRVAERCPTVPKAVSEIGARALEKDASRRYPSAVEMAEQLKQAKSLRLAAAPETMTYGAAPTRHKPRWMQALGVVLIAALISLAVWSYHSRSPAGGAGLRTQSIAVMNVRAAADDQGASAFAQDLPEELGVALSKTGLQIASHESVLQLGGSVKPRDVGAQLGVDAVLEGSVRSVGSKIKLHVELANTRTGFMVWSDTFTVEGEDALNGEQKTAGEIAQELRQALATPK